ncbi:hypothetical protein [Microbacterium sp. 10M-3C3]|uniref:hypothetical protein n=1 Tax=Microbacterium sp. 10M-3C3 TaxID=2483401 RepID=UPI000F630E40|nr:hypothetical protein [Microbacterium sp. 10M-3C3]
MGNLRGTVTAFIAVLTVAAATLLGPPPVSAQSSYGGDSYGAQTYSAEDDSQGEQVLPPNTGFQLVVQAASTQPWLFWGSTAAVVAASGGVAWMIIKKRKQEN